MEKQMELLLYEPDQPTLGKQSEINILLLG